MNKDYLNNTLLGKAESLIGTKAMDNLLGSRKNQQSKESLKKNGHPDYVRDDDGTKEIYEKTIDKLYSKSLNKIIEENIKYHNEFNKAAKEWDKWYTGAQDRKAKTQEEANKFYNEPGAKLNASSNVLMNKVSEKEYNKIQSEAYEISTGSKINKKRLDSFIIFGYK